MAKSFREILWDTLQQASLEAHRSNSSIRIRGNASILESVIDFDPFYSKYNFDIQVTLNGCIVGPNIKEI